jgi:hypothetical protein
MHTLAGKPLRYLIGGDDSDEGRDGEVIELSFDAEAPPDRGIGIKYCNLFDEENSGDYGPYLKGTDVSKDYDEGQIDPHGPGWQKNLNDQFSRAKKQGFVYIELDNPDAYAVADVVGAVSLAQKYGLKVVAKNPGLVDGDRKAYVAHPNVVAVIVEKDAGMPDDMDALRRAVGKPEMQVWFVAFGGGKAWADKVAAAAGKYKNMGVTYCTKGEYKTAADLLVPTAAA